MALNCYLRLTCETQGEVKGSCTQAGREDSMECIAFHHEVKCPRDPSSGLPTGKRHHMPITITKAIDKASPLLASALTNNENISTWRLEFWKPSRAGKEFQFYTVELVNASIASVRSEMLNNKFPENANMEVREHWAFCYQKVIWTWEDGGITAEDDWETPVS